MSWRGLARLARALCLTDGRLSFVSPDPARQTTTPPLGQCVFYFGDDVARFCEHFQDVGVILRLLSAPAADAALFPLELPAPAPARSGRSGTYGQIPAKVLAALQAHGTMGATAHTLATAVAVPYGQVWTTLERLVKQNKAAKAGTLYLATKGEV